MISPFIFVPSVIIGSLTFLLAIPLSVLQLTAIMKIQLYYNLVTIAVVSSMGLYFLIMYTSVYFAYREIYKAERLRQNRILKETNVRPGENYSIRMM